MKRGEVWWVRFPVSSSGGEIRKPRPSVILSNDSSNRFLNRIQVVPLTTKVEKLYPSEAYVTVRGRRHKAMADQLTTVDKGFVQEKVGTLREEDLESVERAVRIQLGLG